MLTIIRGKSDSEIFTATPSFACPECLTVFFGTLPAGFTALGLCEACRSKLPECEGCGTPCAVLNEVRFDQADGTDVARLCDVCTKGVGSCR